MKSRASKLKTITAAAKLVPDGARLALGGFSIHNRPCGFVRELIRRGAKNLQLYGSPIGSFDLELLIAAGCAKSIAVPVVTLEQHGLCPMYRQAAETGSIEILEGDEATLVGGYMAALGNVPYHPITSVKGADLLGYSPHIVRDSEGAPAYGEGGVLYVNRQDLDVCIIHAAEADTFGNVRHAGAVSADLMLAKIAKTVIVTAERVVEAEEMQAQPDRISIPGFYIDAVVELPFGAHPMSCHGEYIHDAEHLEAYLRAAAATVKGREKNAVASYLKQYAKTKPETYLDRCGGRDLLKRRLHVSHDAVRLNDSGREPENGVNGNGAAPKDASPQELMAVVLSREIQDGETSLVGLASSIALSAALLAQRRHAPNSTIVTTAGFVNPKPPALYLSCSDGRYAEGAEGFLDFYEIFELSEQEVLDWFCYGGIQIDRFGNVNITVLGSLDEPKLRGPGLANISFGVTAKRTYLQTVNHTPRTLVDRVDYISAPGHIDGPSGRADAGITTRGPVMCVTPLCTFSFPKNTGSMAVSTVHPGVTWAQVTENTGFPLDEPNRVKYTKAPTRDELAQLRAIDTTGLLRQ